MVFSFFGNGWKVAFVSIVKPMIAWKCVGCVICTGLSTFIWIICFSISIFFSSIGKKWLMLPLHDSHKFSTLVENNNFLELIGKIIAMWTPYTCFINYSKFSSFVDRLMSSHSMKCSFFIMEGKIDLFLWSMFPKWHHGWELQLLSKIWHGPYVVQYQVLNGGAILG